MWAHDLSCSYCGRQAGDPWPDGVQQGWMTETVCFPCWDAQRKKRDEQRKKHEEEYRAAVEVLLGRFTDEQFQALKVVLRGPTLS